MSRSSLKNIMKLIDTANNEVPINEQFLNDLTNSIEKYELKNSRLPSKTYKPSGMNCERSMVYQILGTEPKGNPAISYQLQGICESGTDRHIRIQQDIERIKDTLNIDCEYVDVAEFVKSRNLPNLEIKDKSGMETKLYNTKYNISFMCDGIVKYKSKYFIFEFKTETSNKFYKRNNVDPKHYNQAIAYSLSFGLDDILFVYENRDLLDKKCYLYHVTDEMRSNLINKINYCDSFVKENKIPPKPEIDKKQCAFCPYKNTCLEDGE